jgi:hypothetical protein
MWSDGHRIWLCRCLFGSRLLFPIYAPYLSLTPFFFILYHEVRRGSYPHRHPHTVLYSPSSPPYLSFPLQAQSPSTHQLPVREGSPEGQPRRERARCCRPRCPNGPSRGPSRVLYFHVQVRLVSAMPSSNPLIVPQVLNQTGTLLGPHRLNGCCWRWSCSSLFFPSCLQIFHLTYHSKPLMTLLFGNLTQQFVNFATVIRESEAGNSTSTTLIPKAAQDFRNTASRDASYLACIGGFVSILSVSCFEDNGRCWHVHLYLDVYGKAFSLRSLLFITSS